MKFNVAYPVTGCQKLIEIDDERKLRAFYDKRISHEVDGDVLGDDFKGYVFKISGGNDKQGFPMKQGVLSSQRVRLLLAKGHSCYRPRRRGERKRKSVRGCIVSSDLSVVNLVVVKRGEQEIPGLTDATKPRRLGPKRASRIRKLFNLEKDDDVRKFVIRRQIVKDGKKPYFKAPKIQRLITPQRLQHKRQIRAEKRKRYEKSRELAKAYNEMLAQRSKADKDKKHSLLAKKRSQSRHESTKAPAAATTTAKPVASAASTKAPAAKGPAAKAPAAKAPAAKPAAKATTAPSKAPAAAKSAASKPAAKKK